MIRFLYLAILASAAWLAWIHPGLAAIRVGLSAAYLIPALALLPGIRRRNARSLTASCFYLILLAMPLIAEAYSESRVRPQALLSLSFIAAYLTLAMRRLRSG